MKRKQFLTMATMAVVLLSGCASASNDEGETTASPESTSATSTLTSNTTESDTAEKNKAMITEGDWTKINQQLQKAMESEKQEVLYENNEAITTEKNGISLIVNGYQYLKCEDFSRNFRIPYDDQYATGGVLLLAATFKNDTDQSVYAGNDFSLEVTGVRTSISRHKELLPTDLMTEMYESKYEIPAKSEVSGYLAMNVKPEAMKKIDEHQTGMLTLPAIYSKPETFKKDDALLQKSEHLIALSADGAKKVETANSFYADRTTVENWGTKTMLVDKGIGETREFEGVKVTFDGYQIADFQPNEDQISRFKNFETGTVMMTAKLTIENGNKEPLNFNNTSGWLQLGNTIKTMASGMLSPDAPEAELPVGATQSCFIVFLMDKESYDKLYQDQEYILDVSIYDKEAARINSNGDLSFTFHN